LNTSTLVQKLWNDCNVLRDDGMSYGDYVEQLTYPLFLKMADERSRPPINGQVSQASPIPAAYATSRWMADMASLGVLAGYFAPPLAPAERAVAALEGWILGVR